MSWKPLPISPRAGAQLPPLLISTAFKEDAYTLHLTDLTSIWSESLDRQTIIERSHSENTSIDPSSSGQFQIFLSKIQLGLEGGDGSVLTVGEVNNEGEGGRPGLVLGVTVKLPGGLVPLQWSFRLFAAPQSFLTIQLVLPLLKAQHTRSKELEGLQEILRQKDHVIEKLVENFKGDLSEVFPHGRTKKKGGWQGEKVKGMPKFVYEKWRTTLETSLDITTETLIEATFGSVVLPTLGSEGILKDGDDEGEEGEWWESMHGMSVNLKTGKMTTGGKGKGKAAAPSSSPVKSVPKPEAPVSKPAATDDSTEDENDDFQVQSTPATPAAVTEDEKDDFEVPSQQKIPDSYPRSPPPAAAPEKKLRAIRGRKAAVIPQPEDESTASENEDEEPKAPSPPPPIESKPKKKLGAIKGKKAVATPPPPGDESTADEDEIDTKQATPPPAKPKKTLGKIGGKKQLPPPPSPKPEAKAGSDTESDRSLEKSSSSATVPQESTPELPAKPKRKLGMIGGKKKLAVEVTPALEVKDEPTSSAPSPKEKLGIIGGKREFSRAPEESGRGSPVGVKAERTPTPELPKRETSQERAHQKREALKRELEQKAKAPVKKKRKF